MPVFAGSMQHSEACHNVWTLGKMCWGVPARTGRILRSNKDEDGYRLVWLSRWEEVETLRHEESQQWLEQRAVCDRPIARLPFAWLGRVSKREALPSRGLGTGSYNLVTHQIFTATREVCVIFSWQPGLWSSAKLRNQPEVRAETVGSCLLWSGRVTQKELPSSPSFPYSPTAGYLKRDRGGHGLAMNGWCVFGLIT